MVLNSPCFTVKSWLVQDQTVPSKDISNLLIADSLLKPIWLSIHLVVYNEEMAIPEQTATDKGISNPLMAGDKYGSVKNHKKIVKNKQARTRESEEYKAEARKSITLAHVLL
ncbi:hypothetical protein Tco_1455325 [Tanacetum coccineum]